MTNGDQPDNPDADDTYLGLRFGLFALLTMLLVALVYRFFTDHHQLCDSISAYYYTPVRAVFVGSLSAVGAALVIYRGGFPFENTALDIAGFSAMVVALVPKGLTPAAVGCSTVNVPSIADRDAIIDVAPPSLTAVGLFGFVIGLLLLRRRVAVTPPPSDAGWFRRLRAHVRPGQLAYLAFAVFLLVAWLDRPLFRDWAHVTSAVTLFVCMILVIGANAWDAWQKGHPAAGRRYWVLAAVMTIGCVGFLLLYSVLTTAVLWAEAVGVVGFTIFWAGQTVELRRQTRRTEV